jgi:hypothetical protein
MKAAPSKDSADRYKLSPRRIPPTSISRSSRPSARKGFKNIVLFDRTKLLSQQPDVTVLTYKKWIELGRRVKPGEHSVVAKQFRLFHKDQTTIMSAAERKEVFAKAQAKAEAQPSA